MCEEDGMEKKKFFPLNLTKSTKELQQLIAEHPDYPIVVLAGEDGNCGDYNWMYCSDIRFGIEDLRTVETPYNDEIVCADRDEFEENMEEWLADELDDQGVDVQAMPEEEFQARLHEEMEKYEPYWQKVIAIWATN